MTEPNPAPIPFSGRGRSSSRIRERVPIQPLSSVADALNDWEADTGRPDDRLASRLRAAIRSGRLVGGTRLPTERQLAVHLRITRNTVVRAYAALEADGLVLRRQGSGTIVASATRALGARPGALSRVVQSNVVQRLVVDATDVDADNVAVEFLGAHARPNSAVDDIVRAAIDDIDASDVVRHPGYMPMGYPPLRGAIAEHLTNRGLPTGDEQILVTSGAQQAIALVATGMLRDTPNVVIEDPTFPGAIDSFRVAGARLLTVAVTTEGIDVEQLGAIVERTDVAVAYVTPTNHNPTGAVMPPSARSQLAELAEATGVVVVEDDALAETGLGEAVPRSVSAFAGGAAVVLSIGSLSKVFWGGLRIGWIRGPRDVVAGLGLVKAAADLGTSVPSQLIAVRLLEHVDRVRALRRAELAESLDLLERLLRDHLPDWTWQPPAGGLSLWVRLPYGSANDLARVALRHGVAIVPGSVMSARSAFDDRIRLPLGRDPATLRSGIERLAEAWTEYENASRFATDATDAHVIV